MVRPLDWKSIPEKYHHIPQIPLAPPQTVLCEIPLEVQEPVDQYEVEGIVGDKLEDGLRQYRVRWKGYDWSHDTWKFREELEDAEEVLKKYLKTKKQMKEAQRGKSGFELAKYPHPVATPSSLSRESRQSAGLQIVSKVVTAAEFIEVRMKRNLLDDLKTIVKPAPDQETYVDAEDMLDRLAKNLLQGDTAG